MTTTNSQVTSSEPGACSGGPALSVAAEAPIARMIQCTRCDARSPLAPPLDAFARWALHHAVATGHRDFRQADAEPSTASLAAASAMS
ncbi:DUF7848 domain-containing protein [Streptomyces yaizuensis]|uniref:DUF7848 domain-containing protein n=1 Tax=Streptomyces yaizuensis TaxID=2989713 RepID=A0ABQ5P834_9ACTN|nr:hypothetical protein [Streptomyces sp. YSPA8]GLF98754.1 hypothetical protein SYYSPA8_30675 [Streptomyces sp. YSPA8]